MRRPCSHCGATGHGPGVDPEALADWVSLVFLGILVAGFVLLLGHWMASL